MKTGWVALLAAMLLTPSSVRAADLDSLVGLEVTVAAVALDGGTLLVVGYEPRLPDDAVTALQLIKHAGLIPGRSRIRLWGISVPEATTPAGRQSLGALDELLQHRPAGPISGAFWVTCTGVDVHQPSQADSYLVARCESGLAGSTSGGDLGAAMLYGGWATADRIVTWADPSDEDLQGQAYVYDSMQRSAREARRGLWALPGM